jgi:hypothetical protein
MAICKLGTLIFAGVLGSALFAGPALAMPANGLATTTSKVGSATKEVQWRHPGWHGPGWRGPGWRGPGWRGPGWHHPGWRHPGWR